MNKRHLSLILLLIFSNCILISQNKDWQPAYIPPHVSNSQLEMMVTKEFGNLKFTVDSAMSMSERNDVVRKTKEYIAQCLELINEKPFDDSIHIYLVPTRNDMKNLIGGPIGGMAGLKSKYNPENSIYCVYGRKHSSLKHEIMHMVVDLKWNDKIGSNLLWLSEGLATFAGPDAEDCDGHIIEERYVHFLQNDILFGADILVEFNIENEKIQRKIAYNQSAYIVQYLLGNFGVRKLKCLWESDMDNFKEIYGIKFNDLILEINERLNRKYPTPIHFNWKGFTLDCIE